ncbi:MAG: glycosyl hydrolase family 18 protein [Pseudomonadota bacterium]
MSNSTFMAYWSGEEPTGPDHSPTLVETPDYVDVVILFYVTITADGDLDFSRLVLHNDQATIMQWMADIRARQQGKERKTRFTLGILGDSFPDQDPSAFSAKVAAAAEEWGVDGITIDYEPPSGNENIIPVVSAIKNALPTDALMTAPIYGAWLGNPLLAPFTALFDYVSTMDYTPYPGYESTLSMANEYARVIGGGSISGWSKLAIGVSCMTFTNGNHTPLDDVIKLCHYQPEEGNKLGIMLYTLSYDAPGHGSPYPLFTYTRTIHENLPEL